MGKRGADVMDEIAVTERWTPIPRFSRYEVSNYGRVRRADDGILVVVSPPDNIHHRVTMIDDLGRVCQKTVHQMFCDVQKLKLHG